MKKHHTSGNGIEDGTPCSPMVRTPETIASQLQDMHDCEAFDPLLLDEAVNCIKRLAAQHDKREEDSVLVMAILDEEPGWKGALVKHGGQCPTMQSAVRVVERLAVLEAAKNELFCGQEEARGRAHKAEQDLAKERAAGQEVHDFLVSCNPDNQYLSVLEAAIQQWGIENKLRKEVNEWKAICKNRDATVNQQGDEWVKLKTKIDLLEGAVADCYMMSKRELGRLRGETGGISGLKSKEAWTHVMRFCEQTGAKSDILRDAVPTEIQGG